MTTGAGDWPASELERVEECPVCGTRERRVIYGGLTDRVFSTAPGTWSLYECLACGCAFLDPRPTRESIGRAYRDYYTHAPGEGVAVSRWRQALINGYYRAHYGCTSRPARAAGRLVVPLLPVRRRTIDATARHLPLPRPNARLLDVGAGSGAAVGQARELGWDAVGIEPDPAAVELAERSGVPVRLGTLDDVELAGATFDAITMSHVLEHMHEPAAALRACRRLLRPGGSLWIATPNLAGAGHSRLGRDWLHLDPPRHLVLFRRRPLVALLHETGFTAVCRAAPPLNAQKAYAAAEAMRGGRAAASPAPPSRSARLRARATDAAAFLRPDLGEELILIAS